MMVVLRSTETLPLLRASEITDQPCVEVGDPSARMPERILSEVAPEVIQPFAELPKRVLGAVCAVKGFHTAIPQGIDIDGTKLRHVTDGGRPDAERRVAVNNDQTTHWGITGRLWSIRNQPVRDRASTSASHRPAKRPCGAIERVVEARETGVPHSRFPGNFGECSQMQAVIGPQPVAFRKLARLATQRRRQLDSEVLGPLGFERLLGRSKSFRRKSAFPT